MRMDVNKLCNIRRGEVAMARVAGDDRSSEPAESASMSEVMKDLIKEVR